MKAESSTTHSGRSEPVPSGVSRRQLSPDTESESEWRAQVELNQGLPSGSSSGRNGPAGATQLPEASNKRKKSNPKSGGNGASGAARNYDYRQPVCRIIPNIGLNEDWTDAIAKCQSNINDPDKSAGAVRRHTAMLNQLNDDNVSWGVIDKHNAGDEGGPCSQCVKRKGDCIVKLMPTGDKRSSGAPRYKIVSRCLRCITINGPHCDLVLPRDPGNKQDIASAQSDSRVASTDLDLVDELEDDDDEPYVAPPKPQSNRTTSKPPHKISTHKAPPPKSRESVSKSMDPPARPKKGRVSQAISDGSETLNSSPTLLIPPTMPTPAYSEADRARVATAISDISEFHTSMKEMFAERNEMDFRTRSMLRLVEESIDVVKQFTEDRR